MSSMLCTHGLKLVQSIVDNRLARYVEALNAGTVQNLPESERNEIKAGLETGKFIWSVAGCWIATNQS